MRLNKKSMILYYPVMVGFVIGLAVFYVTSLSTELAGETNFAGEISLNYIKAAELAEADLLYIQDSAKQSIHQSIYDLSNNGGFYKLSECGSSGGFNLWTTESQTCYPNPKEELKSVLQQKINDHLIKNTNTANFVDNYDFIIKEEDGKLRIIGIATIPIEKPIEVKDKQGNKMIQKKVGMLSMKPSFEHIVDYEIKDYQTLKQKSADLAIKCEGELDIEECVRDEVKEVNQNGELRWYISSKDSVERIFYDFVDKYESCLKSETIGCTCDFDQDQNDPGLMGKYSIAISKDGFNTRIYLLEPEGYGLFKIIEGSTPAVISDVYTGAVKRLDSFKYVVVYSSSGNHETTILATPLTTFDFDFTKETRLYKKDKDTVAFVRKDSKEYQQLSECIKPNLFRFTVVDEKTKFLVYNQKTEKVGFNPIEIRFGIYIKDLPPPPIEGLKAQSELKKEGTVILRWKKSPATDVLSYNVYYSQNKFETQEIKNNQILDPNSIIGITGKIDSKSISSKVDDAYVYRMISQNPIFNSDINGWAHIVVKDTTTALLKLESNKAYYLEDSEEYIYVLDGLEDNKEYYFAVTAIDKARNEIDNIDPKQKLKQDINYVMTKPIDTLSPNKVTNIREIEPTYSEFDRKAFAYGPPTTNEDGTPLNKLIIKDMDGSTSTRDKPLFLYIYQIPLGISDTCNFGFVQDKLTMPVTKKLEAPFEAEAIPPIGTICYAFIVRDLAQNPQENDQNLKNLVQIYGPVQIP